MNTLPGPADISPMTYGPNVSKEYLRNAVNTASPEQLHLMLLDGAIRFTVRGIEALAADEIEASFNAFDRAQRIVIELSNGLVREVNPTVVDQMTALYGFIFRRLVDANLHREQKPADEALRILRYQRETWALLIERLHKETNAPPPAGASADDPGLASSAAGPDETPTRFVAEG